MEYDTDKIDEAVLAILYINDRETGMAWKSVPWESTNRLHEKGLISNPISKAKSVQLLPEAIEKAESIINKLFKK